METRRTLEDIPAIRETFMNRVDWLLYRKSGIGGSEAPILFGEGYSSQSQVAMYADKIGQEVAPLSEDQQEYMAIGKLMELTTRPLFGLKTGLSVIDPGEFTIWKHATIPHMLATLDGLCFDPEINDWAVVELKSIAFKQHEWQDDEPPLRHAIQVQHQLACTGLKRGYLLGLIGNKATIFCIGRNDSFIDQNLIPRCNEFWHCVINRELPPVDSSDATKRALASIYRDMGEEILLDASFNDLDSELVQLKASAKTIDERKELIENKLRAAIGDATSGLLHNGARYSWKDQHRKGYEVKPSTFRVLRRHN